MGVYPRGCKRHHLRGDHVGVGRGVRVVGEGRKPPQITVDEVSVVLGESRRGYWTV